MHRFILPLVALAIFLGVAAPLAADPIKSGTEHCVVNVRPDDPLNLRAGPGSGSAILTRHAYGSCGLIVTGSCRGSWCPVEDGHYAGWMHRRYIAALPGAEFCFVAAAPSEMRALRAWPALHSRVLTQLSPAQCGIKPLPYAVEGWQKVRATGWEGWLPRAALAHTGD